MGPRVFGEDEDDVDDVRAALEEYGYETDDIGNKSSFDNEWVAQETGVSTTEAAEAEHFANDDMAAAGDMGIPANRHGD